MKNGRRKVKMTLFSAALVFFVTAVMTGMAGAQGGNGMMRGGMMQGGMMGPNARLTPEERRKVARVRADFWKKTEDLRGDIYRKRLEMQIEMSRKSPDEATVMKIEDELLALQGKLARMRVRHQLALKAINPRLGMMGPGMMRGGMMQGGMMGRGMGRHHGMMGGCMKKSGMMGMGRGAGMMGGGMPANPVGGEASVPAPESTPAAGGTGSGEATQ